MCNSDRLAYVIRRSRCSRRKRISAACTELGACLCPVSALGAELETRIRGLYGRTLELRGRLALKSHGSLFSQARSIFAVRAAFKTVVIVKMTLITLLHINIPHPKRFGRIHLCENRPLGALKTICRISVGRSIVKWN